MFSPSHLIRRLLRQGLVTVTLIVGIALAVALGVAVPLATNALAALGLRSTIAALPPVSQNIQLTRTVVPFGAGLRERLRRELGPIIDSDYLVSYAPFIAAVGPAPFSTGPVRLRTQEGLLDHITITGRAPQTVSGSLRAGVPRGLTPSCATVSRVEVLLNAMQSQALGIGIGAELCIGEVVPVTVVGTYTARDEQDPYWLGDLRPVRGEVLVDQTGVTPVMVLITTSEDFPKALQLFNQQSPTYIYRLITERDAINLDTLGDADTRLKAFRNQVTTLQPRPVVLTGLDRAITTYSTRFRLLQGTLYVLLLPVIMLAILFVVLVGTLATEQQSSEMAVLRSRGGSGLQVLGGQASQALVLIVPGLFAGIGLGTLLVILVSQTSIFQQLGGAPLALRFSARDGIVLGLILGATLLALLWAARPALAQSLVTLRRERVRPAQRNRLGQIQSDGLFLMLAVLGYWQLRRYGGGLITTLDGEARFNVLVLAAPALMLIAGSLLFLRLFPVVVRLLSSITSRRPGIVAALSTWQLARNPLVYGRLVLLLTLTVGLGVYTQTVTNTINREQLRQALNEVGADVRRPLEDIADPQQVQAQYPGATSSLLSRLNAELLTSNNASEVQRRGRAALVGVDGVTLAEVLRRSGSDNQALLAALPVLSGGRLPPLGLALPNGTTGLAVEVQGRSSNLTLYAKIAGLNGTRQVQLGVPADDWQTLRSAIPADLQPPLALQSLYAVPDKNAIGSTSQGLVWDNIVADVAGQPIVLEAWDQLDGWEAVGAEQGQVTLGPARDTAGDRGLSARLAFGALTNDRYAALRFVVPRTLPIYGSTVAGNVSVVAGQTMTLDVAGQRFQAQIQGRVAGLPGLDDDRENVLIADRTRLAEIVTYGLPTTLRPTEMRFALAPGAEPPPSAGAITKAQALLVQISDPLSNGVGVILLLGFICAAVLSIIGFVTYAALSIRARAIDWAVLRALGLAPRQLLLLLLAEQGAVLLGGIVGGTVSGLVLALTTRPFLQVVTNGADEVAVAVQVESIALIIGSLLLLLLLALGVLVFNVQRRGLLRALRLGEA